MRHLVPIAWLTLGLAGVLRSPVPAHAQGTGAEIEGVPAEPGAAVRLFTIEGTGSVDGVLLPSSAGTWRVRTDDRGIVEVRADDVMSAELRTTHSQLVPGALIGTAMGLVAGSIYHGANNGDGGCLVPNANCAGHAAGPSPLTSFVLIPAVGTVLGGVIGSQRQSSQWIPAVLPGRNGAEWTASWSLAFGG